MLSMQPFSHRRRPAALPVAEVTISHILVPTRCEWLELEVRCISSDLGVPRALLIIEPNRHIQPKWRLPAGSHHLQYIHSCPKHESTALQDLKESLRVSTWTLKAGQRIQVMEHRNTTGPPSGPPLPTLEEPWGFRRGTFWPFPFHTSPHLSSAVQVQSFQPERDSFQDQSSPPQSLPEALLAKPMHPLQPL